MLCLAGSLTSLGKSYSRLWSENFDDELFVDGLKTWLRYGSLQHSLSYLHPVPATHPVMATEAGKLGRNVVNMFCAIKKLSVCSTPSVWE